MDDPILQINYKQPEVFQDFFRENFRKLLLFSGRYLNDTDLAADVAQECFIRLWNSKAEFQSEEKMMAFLYTTARNLSLDHIKHSGIVSAHMQRCPEESELYFSEAVAEEEIYEMVYRAIDRLAPQSRKVILLSLEGKSNTEIAETLSISVNSVRTHKQNAHKKLRSFLQQYFIFFLLLQKK